MLQKRRTRKFVFAESWVGGVAGEQGGWRQELHSCDCLLLRSDRTCDGKRTTREASGDKLVLRPDQIPRKGLKRSGIHV